MTTISSTEPNLTIAGRLGTITLRRPIAINAVTPEDIAQITILLRRAVAEPYVETILLRGEGDRGFCAGGDIKRVRELIAARNYEVLTDFWSAEYRLDHLIATCPKPVVTIAHGLTLGGGMGLASHASHRVVTDSSRLGMPEVLIGLSPDIGGLWLYANAPGHTGTYAALTGAQLDAGDALYMRLADHYVPSGDLGNVLERLLDESPTTVFAEFSECPPSWVGDHRSAIDTIFGAGSVENIAQQAARVATEAPTSAGRRDVAERTSTALAEASPTALAVTLEALNRAKAMASLGECLVQDLTVSQSCSRYPDLAEGIRARVVDKDRTPRWKPATLGDVEDSAVAEFFEPTKPLLQLETWEQ